MQHRLILAGAAVLAFFLVFKIARENWKLLKDANFRHGDLDSTEVDTPGECRVKCKDLDACKAYVITKKPMGGKYKCWLKEDEIIRGEERMKDKDKNTFIKDDHFAFWKDNLAASRDSENRSCAGKVKLYKDGRFQGEMRTLGCGVHEIDWGFEVSSFKIPPGLKMAIREKYDGKRGFNTQEKDMTTNVNVWFKGDHQDMPVETNDRVKIVEIRSTKSSD